jgi:periplasmic divalent cation tolerance protein
MPVRLRGQGALVVLVTCPTQRIAQKMAHTLVEQRQAACVNVIPGLTSIYRWEGKIRRDTETLLVIKTRRMRLPGLTRLVKSLHPYSIPEVLAVPVAGGSGSYLSWVHNSTT